LEDCAQNYCDYGGSNRFEGPDVVDEHHFTLRPDGNATGGCEYYQDYVPWSAVPPGGAGEVESEPDSDSESDEGGF